MWKYDWFGAVHRLDDDTLYEAASWNTERQIEDNVYENVKWVELSDDCVRCPLVSSPVLKALHTA